MRGISLLFHERIPINDEEPIHIELRLNVWGIWNYKHKYHKVGGCLEFSGNANEAHVKAD